MMENLKPLQRTLALAKKNIAEARKKQLIMLDGTCMELRGVMTLNARLLLMALKARLPKMTKARTP